MKIIRVMSVELPDRFNQANRLSIRGDSIEIANRKDRFEYKNNKMNIYIYIIINFKKKGDDRQSFPVLLHVLNEVIDEQNIADVFRGQT